MWGCFSHDSSWWELGRARTTSGQAFLTCKRSPWCMSGQDHCQQGGHTGHGAAVPAEGWAGRALKRCQLDQGAVGTQQAPTASLRSASTTTGTHPNFPETHTTGRQDTWQGAFPIHLTILVIQAIRGFSLKNPSLFVSVVKQKGCSDENLFLHFQIIPGPHIHYNTPAKFILSPWAMCSTAQPEGQAGCVAQGSTAGSLLYGSTGYIGLLVGITA